MVSLGVYKSAPWFLLTGLWFVPQVRVRWFYHAEETEGTGEGGRRIQDLSEPVSHLFSVDRYPIQQNWIFVCVDGRQVTMVLVDPGFQIPDPVFRTCSVVSLESGIFIYANFEYYRVPTWPIHWPMFNTHFATLCWK